MDTTQLYCERSMWYCEYWMTVILRIKGSSCFSPQLAVNDIARDSLKRHHNSANWTCSFGSEVMIKLSEVEVIAGSHANYNFSWTEVNGIFDGSNRNLDILWFREFTLFAGYVGSLMRQKWNFLALFQTVPRSIWNLNCEYERNRILMRSITNYRFLWKQYSKQLIPGLSDLFCVTTSRGAISLSKSGSN